jgi:hypothetical protein
MFKAKVGYDAGNGEMFVDQTQVFETKVEAEDWLEFMMNMSSDYDVVEINKIN